MKRSNRTTQNKYDFLLYKYILFLIILILLKIIIIKIIIKNYNFKYLFLIPKNESITELEDQLNKINNAAKIFEQNIKNKERSEIIKLDSNALQQYNKLYD